MNIKDPAYQGHPVFDELAKNIDFYRDLSTRVLSFITQGTKSLVNIDTYFLSSVGGTLDSISLVLSNGRINDAWALLRKYYDSVVINIYYLCYLKNNFSLDNFIVDEINGWVTGQTKIPNFKTMSKYIHKCSILNDINKIVFNDGSRYRSLRKRCNDNMHYNLFSHVILNDNEVYNKNRKKYLSILLEDVRNIFFMHITYLFYMNECYMASSDYVDYLDCGMTPPENSQYWVAPFVQETIDRMSEHRPELVALLRDKTSMDLM